MQNSSRTLLNSREEGPVEGLGRFSINPIDPSKASQNSSQLPPAEPTSREQTKVQSFSKLDLKPINLNMDHVQQPRNGYDHSYNLNNNNINH